LKRNDFLFKICEQKCLFSFLSTQFFGKFSHSEKNSGKYYYKCTCVFVSSPAIRHRFSSNINLLPKKCSIYI